MKSISDQIIWITGASSGIGEALAYELNNSGNTLILSARNTTRLEEVRAKCRFPDTVYIEPLDLADHDHMPQHVSNVLNMCGKVNILINNAGLSQRSLIIDTQMSVYKKLIDINYLGTVALTKALLPHFIENNGGHFVSVTSLMGRFGSPLRSGYCGAKHGLHGFFDVLRMEHQSDHIDVSLVCPGFVQTNVALNALTADGTTQQKNDLATGNGMPVAVFAHKMIRAIAQKKFEVYIGRKEIMGIYLKRFFPKLLHRVVLRSNVV
jgi:short-subunit dehydrogenase